MPLFVELTRSGRVESSHTIHVAVVDPTGALVARSGDVDRFAYWRSSAKPFQALPLVEDGGADRFGFGDEELALCCASHSSEPEHLQGVRRMLERIGCTEDDLACGGHPPLSAAVAAQLARSGDEPSPVWSNCSGKHAGMLAQAKHHGWATRGYELASHPVQQRIISVVSKYTDLAPEALQDRKSTRLNSSH